MLVISIQQQTELAQFYMAKPSTCTEKQHKWRTC